VADVCGSMFMEDFGIAVDGKSSFKEGCGMEGTRRAGSGRNIPLDLQVNFLPNPMLTPFPTEPLKGRIRL
jgi:hypothetical protein